MQSLLIDVNTGFIKHRLVVLSSLLSENYAAVIGSLDAMNALLPDKYRVVVDTDEYLSRIRGNMVALCSYCTITKEVDDGEGKTKIVKLPAPTDYETIRTYPKLLRSWDAWLYGSKYMEVWRCPKCKQENDIRYTEFEKTILKEPHYLGIIEAPPIKTIGILDRSTYPIKFERWARKFLAELEAAAGRFRAEYKPKKGENPDGIMIDTEGEGLD